MMSSAHLEELIKESVDKISKAKNPVVLVAVDVHRMNLGDQVRKWIEKNSFPFVCSMGAKSLIPESHPNFLGIYEGRMSRDELANFVESSDCLIKLGFYETDFSTGMFSANLQVKNTIMVRRDKAMVGYHSYDEVGLATFMESIAKVDIPRGQRIPKENWPTYDKNVFFKPEANKKLTMKRFVECLEDCLKTR
jgi:indolepyruvate decarboxylase